MSNNLPTVNKEKTLPDERYDEKLFKQAYKAGLEAKKLDIKKSKKKRVLKIFLILLSVILISSVTLFLLSLRKEKIEYIEAISTPKQNMLVPFEEGNEIDLLPTDISVGNISAQSALVFSINTGATIFEKNSTERKSIASITKLVSVLVALDTYNLEETIEVSLENIPEDLDWKLELKQGDRIKIDYLLKAMLLSSYNDCAYILANAYPYGGYDGFIKAMNSKAKSLRLTDTMFNNPAGLDNEMNYSTAQDVGKIVSSVLMNEYILDITGKSSLIISWNEGEELKSKTIFTTNQLYGVNPYIKGLKTGITDNAGQCFVGYFVYPNGIKLITVILESEDRFTDTQTIEKLSRKVLEVK